jgi:hypothetical protein
MGDHEESRGMRAGSWERGGKPRERGKNHWGEAKRSRKRMWEIEAGRRGRCRGEWWEGRRVPVLGVESEREDDGGVGSDCRKARAGKHRTAQE